LRVFGKDHDKYERMVACWEAEPVCVDKSSDPEGPFCFIYSTVFLRAFAILCHCLGHTPSVDVFLFFFEAKSPGKKLWVSFNSVAGRVLLTLFQQSYKGFKKNLFKVRSNRRDLTLLDGFPLYWMEKPNLQRPKWLEDLLRKEREVCELLSRLHTPFSTLELLKLEFSPKYLKKYIGTPLIPVLCLPIFYFLYQCCPC